MSHQMSTGNSHINTRLTLKEKYFFKKLKLYIWYYSTLNKYKQNCVVYIWYYSLGISTGSFFSLPAACLLFSRGWLSRALAFCSLFYPWLLWLSLTTRSIRQGRQLVDFAGFRDFNNCSSDLIMIYSSHFFLFYFMVMKCLPAGLITTVLGNIEFLKTSSPALETSSTSIQLTKRCQSEIINWLSSLTP